MVEFCTVCGTSLPKGDLSFKGGKMFTSSDYTCPSCGKLANPGHTHESTVPEASPDQDLVFKKGQVNKS
jgi:hypothetical protein